MAEIPTPVIKFRLLEYPLLLTPFVFSERVLDAWVGKHIENAREWFDRREKQKGRDIWIELPVKVQDKIISELSPEDLKRFFHSRQVQILIHGEGGVGKTSLACQVARWAMAEKSSARLRPHLMLPLLFESDFVESATAANVTEPLAQELERISGQSSQELPDRFRAALFSKGRILVIIDGLSERSSALREFLINRAGTDPFQCTLFTSRKDERDVLVQVALTRLQPFRLQGHKLMSFMQTYLEALDLKVHFTDREVMSLCEGLSDAAGDRDITAMLATMYAKTAVRRKKGEAGPDDPQTIPELMSGYVKQICERARMSAIDDVRTILQRISWECVRDDFRPKPISRERALEAASGKTSEITEIEKNVARTKVDQLENTLRLLQPVGAGATELKVALDPLAEYMAAAFLVKQDDPKGKKWERFLQDVDAVLKDHKAEEIRGFLLAVREYLPTTRGVPAWLETALLDRAHYDLRTQTESRRDRRLRFFVFRLREGDPAEKLAAIENIENAGYLDPDAEAALAQAAKHADPGIRATAVYALGQLDAHSRGARDALMSCLKDDDANVRHQAVYSTSIAGPDPQQKANLILPLAFDPEATVRYAVANNLVWIDTLLAEPELRRLAQYDENHSVRVAAASSWVRITPGSESLCALARALDGADDIKDYDFPTYARLFGKHESALECLVERLDDSRSSVRTVCLRLLAHVEKGSAALISEKVKAFLKDDDENIALWAAVALHNWGLAKDDVATLLKRLSRSENAGVRANALGILAKASTDKDVNELLKAGLDDKDGRVRSEAAVSLYARDHSNSQAKEVLWDVARNGNAQSRYAVARAVHVGPLKTLRSDEMNELIVQLMADEHSAVRTEIAEVALDRQDATLLRALLSHSNDPDADARKRVAKAFGLMKIENDTDLAALRLLLQDIDYSVQLEAAKSYWKITRKGADILPVLYQFQSAHLFFIRSETFDLVTEIAKAGQADLGLIHLGLEDGYIHTRHSAMGALLASGFRDVETNNKVIKLLDDDYEYVRSDAMEYLVRAGVITEVVRRHVLESVQKERNGHVRIRALGLMAELAPLTDLEVEGVLETVRDADDDTRIAACEALADAGVPARLVLRSVSPVRTNMEELARRRMQHALVRLGKSDMPDSAAQFARLARDSHHSDVRSAILEVIRDLGTVPELAVPPLTELLSDGDASVVELAARLIGDSGTTDPAALQALAYRSKAAPTKT